MGNFSGLVCATDLVKSSKDTASLQLALNKKIFGWGCGFFVSDVLIGSHLGHLGILYLAGPGPKSLDGSISLKFLLETRLQSKSFDTLNDLLRFQVQKL